MLIPWRVASENDGWKATFLFWKVMFKGYVKFREGNIPAWEVTF